MVKCILGRWFIILTTTTNRTVRIAVDQIAVVNDDGATSGIVTNTGFIAAIPKRADDVWAIIESIKGPNDTVNG